VVSLPPALTLKNSTWCSHCWVFCKYLRTDSDLCFVRH